MLHNLSEAVMDTKIKMAKKGWKCREEMVNTDKKNVGYRIWFEKKRESGEIISISSSVDSANETLKVYAAVQDAADKAQRAWREYSCKMHAGIFLQPKSVKLIKKKEQEIEV